MVDINNKEIFDTIKEAIITVPGVISFANYLAKSESDIRTTDISRSIEISPLEQGFRYKIHIILMYGVNIRDVVTEVQIRVKYELEKLSKFTCNYIVDVAVDDLALI